MPTALITGAGGGLGTQLARKFANASYDLILHTRESPVGEYPDVQVNVITGDLNDKNTNERLIDIAKVWEVDVVILNAAEYLNKPFSEMTEYELSELMCTDLISPMVLLRGLWPIFETHRQGIVININSLAGLSGGKHETAYSASKHGLRGLMASLQFEATRIGVSITDVFLGAMNTPMNEDSGNPLKKIDPMEVANTILNLCNALASSRTFRIPEITIARRNY